MAGVKWYHSTPTKAICMNTVDLLGSSFVIIVSFVIYSADVCSKQASVTSLTRFYSYVANMGGQQYFSDTYYASQSSLIVSYQLPAAYIIAKLSADSILDNNQKTPIVCGKCHVVHDVTILLS